MLIAAIDKESDLIVEMLQRVVDASLDEPGVTPEKKAIAARALTRMRQISLSDSDVQRLFPHGLNHLRSYDVEYRLNNYLKECSR